MHPAEDPVVQVGHRRGVVRPQRPQQIDRLHPELGQVDHPVAVVTGPRVRPGHPAGHLAMARQQPGQPVVDAGLTAATRGHVPTGHRRNLRRAPGTHVQTDPVVQADAAARSRDHDRFGREARLGVGLEDGAGAVGIAEYGLVHAFRDGQVGQRVVDLHEPLDLLLDGLGLYRLGRRQLRVPERVRGRTGARDVPYELKPVDHIARLHLLDRGARRRRLGARQLRGDQRERRAQRGDEEVDFGNIVLVVQPALEAVAEQRAE